LLGFHDKFVSFYIQLKKDLKKNNISAFVLVTIKQIAQNNPLFSTLQGNDVLSRVKKSGRQIHGLTQWKMLHFFSFF
jgi:hypothetical protein